VTRAILRLHLLLALLCALGGAPAWPAPASLSVSVIDVGQGDPVLVQFPNGTDMLVDAGDQAAGPTVVRYLRSRGIARIDSGAQREGGEVPTGISRSGVNFAPGWPRPILVAMPHVAQGTQASEAREQWARPTSTSS
jgi:hypothetical protein